MSYPEQVGVVFDTGSACTKAGFAAESFPRIVIPTTVGRFHQATLHDGFPDIYCGKEAIQKRGVSTLTWPVRDGVVKNWDDMEKLWHHLFYKELHYPPERAQVMHSVHPLIPRRDREKMAEILFEAFTVQGLFLAKSPALVLHASGRTTGLVFESGACCSYATPVFEGFPLINATVTSPLTGTALTGVLQKSLADLGYSFTTPLELDLLDQIKGDLCYVPQDYKLEINSLSSKNDKIQYNLPDGQHIVVGQERLLPEVLFQPSLQGFNCPNVVEVITSSINKCDYDYKPTFYENIVISGGSSMFTGFQKRLSAELSLKVKQLPGYKVNIDEISQRQYLPWVGGSILASLSSMKGFWMSRKEYEDVGAEGINHKLLSKIMSTLFENPAVVIDNGCHSIKAGFSCDNHPIAMFRNIVGRPKYLKGSCGKEYYDVYIGDEAAERRQELDFSHPVVGGKIVNWDDMERVWHHVFYKVLKVAPEERATMLADSPVATMEEKNKSCEIFFETLNAPGICIAPQSVLSIYGSGFVTGICVDLGYEYIDINPVFEGGIIKYAHLRTPIAGAQISKYIRDSLSQRGFDKGRTHDIVEDIKSKCCFVIQDPTVARKKSHIERKYKLPSGEEIDVTNEAGGATELLFQHNKLVDGEEGLPLHKAIEAAANKCDPDIRNTMYGAIVPCGGLAAVPGLNERLKSELDKLTGRSVFLAKSTEPYCINWLGAAAFSGLKDVSKVWITKAQYQEEGERIVRYKFL